MKIDENFIYVCSRIEKKPVEVHIYVFAILHLNVLLMKKEKSLQLANMLNTSVYIIASLIRFYFRNYNWLFVLYLLCIFIIFDCV